MKCTSNIIRKKRGGIKVVSERSKYYKDSVKCDGSLVVEFQPADYASYDENSFYSISDACFIIRCAVCHHVEKILGCYEVEEILQFMVDSGTWTQNKN